MIRDLLKWVAPGLATVLGGTALLLVTTSANIANDVGSQGRAAMQSAGYDWAELTVDARDVVLSGTTTDQTPVDSATDRLANLPSVRSVTAKTTLAPLAKPYSLEASIDGDVVELSGGVPDETTKQLLLSRAGIEQGTLDLRSGMPDRQTWLAGAQYAIDQLKYLDQGHVTVSDLAISLNGRARSERDFRDLLIVMRAGAPAGLTLASVDIVPALISPYKWSATSDGTRINVEGFVPDEALVERLRAADVSGLPVATGLALGSGEPAGFAELSQTLIEQLSRLEYGSASITDGESSLTGAPPSAEIADDIVAQLQSSGSIVVLDPPRIEDYWVSATRQPGGLTIFDGYVPDEATREKLAQLKGADTSWLKLGRGAPERYQSAVDFGLAALTRMSEGRFALRDNVVTLSGVAASGADYAALLSEMAGSAPQGLVLARAEILAPRADQYSWTASKDTTGAVVLSGMAPSPDVEAALVAAAGPATAETMSYASGEPNNFAASAQTGIGLLQWLSDGKVVYDSAGWTVTGNAKTPIDKGAIEADFVTRQLAAAGWSMAVAEPIPTEPIATVPYVWSASKTADGQVTLTGLVPAEALQRSVAERAGEGAIDQTTIDPTAPQGFAEDVVAAIDTLPGLAEGAVRFDGTQWSVEGTLLDANAASTIDTALAAAATPSNSWLLTLISSPPPAPPVVAEPPAVAEPAAEPAQVDLDYAFSASRSADGTMILSGQLPADASLRYLAVITKGDTAAVSIAPGAPPTFLGNAVTGLRALMQLSEGQLDFAAGSWSLKGVAADATIRDAVVAAVAADPGGKTWQLTVDVPTPAPADPIAAPTPAPATAAPEPTATAPVDIAACQAPLADFSARNAILFQSGAAIIAAESEPALDELATDLAACPDAVVHIEGHTDADGDEQLNLALSVARAEAVVDALVERGVTSARLYAVGYGESQPIADNETTDGKRLNRRIVVTVTGEHY